MSNAEIAPPSSPTYSYLMPALAVGVSVNTVAIPNYLGACSKIIGCVRAVAGGVSQGGVVAVQGATTPAVGPPAVAGRATITLTSLQAPGDDTSQFRVFWVNELSQSQIASIQAC
jgi:hypothetical protein